MNPVDQWLAINAKYFPTEQVQYIRQRLEALPEQQLSMLYSISFQDPTMMLVISLFGGSLGIDRFILGQSLTGSLSWMLLANQTLKNSLQLLANEKLFYTLVGLPPAFFETIPLTFRGHLRNLSSTPSNTTQFNPKTVWP